MRRSGSWPTTKKVKAPRRVDHESASRAHAAFEAEKISTAARPADAISSAKMTTSQRRMTAGMPRRPDCSLAWRTRLRRKLGGARKKTSASTSSESVSAACTASTSSSCGRLASPLGDCDDAICGHGTMRHIMLATLPMPMNSTVAIRRIRACLPGSTFM